MFLLSIVLWSILFVTFVSKPLTIMIIMVSRSVLVASVSIIVVFIANVKAGIAVIEKNVNTFEKSENIPPTPSDFLPGLCSS